MLQLNLADNRTHADLFSSNDLSARFGRLRLRFPDAETLSVSRIRLPVDSLLSNLDALAGWTAEEVQWQPELLRLVEDNYSEALRFDELLARPLARSQVDDTAVASEVVEIADEWTAPLTPLQWRDLAKLNQLHHGANFSVPGAGKTRTSLAQLSLARERNEVAGALVVAPKSAFEAWQHEVEVCLPHYSVGTDHTFGLSHDITLVNYERLPTASASLAALIGARPTMLILDEAHRMKLGGAGAWGAACYALGTIAAKRLILSGTPAPNGPKDLENLFAFVWPGQGRRRVRRAIGDSSLAEASRALKPLYARTTKAELGLPPVKIRERRVALPPLHRAIYDALAGSSAQARPSEFDDLGRVLMYLMMATTSPALLAAGGSRYEPLRYRVPPLAPPPGSDLLALMSDLPDYELSPKYAEVFAIVRKNAREGRKTLVWSTFVRNLTTMQRLLDEFNPAIVHGGTEDRDAEIRKFRHDPTCLVLLSNPATLGEGISLHHECHDAIFVDRDFAAGRYLQSLDRIHRLGLAPDTETNVTLLLAEDTIDEVVSNRLSSKLRFLLGVLDDPIVNDLTDLDTEPAQIGGMDSTDMQELLTHLSRYAARA